MSYLYWKCLECIDQVIGCCGDANQGFRLLGSSDGSQKHHPAAHTGTNQNLHQGVNNTFSFRVIREGSEKSFYKTL